MERQKLYCYADETGQDTVGDFFLVATTIFDARRQDELRRLLLKFEMASGKGEQKWTRATHSNRIAYIRNVLRNPAFFGALYFSLHGETVAYDDLMILSITKAIEAHVASREYAVVIVIDGLQRAEKMKYAKTLRRFGVKFRKIRGVNDKNDPFIRLADALAGFVRDAKAGDLALQKLYERALRKGVIRKI